MKHCSMSFLRLFVSLSLVLLFFASCRDNGPDEPKVHRKKTTLFLYIAAENTLGSFVSSDSLEIAKGLATMPDSVQVAVFFDNLYSSKLFYGTSKQGLKAVKTYNHNVCSTDSTEMEAVLSDFFRFFPAEHYGIIFWSHASGWVPQNRSAAPRRTFGIDNGARSGSTDNGPQLAVPTLARILAHHPHTDFLFFDACFMQCIEVAYQLRNVTDYVIASPAEIPGDGAPYTLVLPALARGNILEAINSYYDYYVSGGGHSEYGGAILSAVRTDKLEELARATRPLVQEVFGGHQVPEISSVQRYYPKVHSNTFSEYYDIVNLFYHNCSAESFSTWRKTFETAVPIQKISTYWASAAAYWLQQVTDPDNCGAVSQFVPDSYYDSKGWTQAYHDFDWYEAAGFDQTGW